MWTEEIFITNYKEKLNNIPERNRGDGFLSIFKELEKKENKIFNIVETGSMRPGFTMDGDGQSTKLFDNFVNYYDGQVITVDLDKNTSNFANTNTTNKTITYNQDSVLFLWNILNLDKVDLFYLDSYDVDFNNPILANIHHFKELVAISKWLKSGVLVAVDDCKFDNSDIRIPKHIPAQYVGKGVFVENFMQNINADIIFDGYQKVWKIK